MTSQHVSDAKDEEKTKTGSPLNGEPVFVAVGKLRRPHGVRGEMKMEVLTDSPQAMVVGQKIFVGEDHQSLTIRSTRWQGDLMLIAFEEYRDRDEVGAFRNEILFMDSADLPVLSEGEFYFHELVGLKVVTEHGEDLGDLVEILETGANDVLIVKNIQGEEILLPAIEEVVIGVDLDEGKIEVHILPGLL